MYKLTSLAWLRTSLLLSSITAFGTPTLASSLPSQPTMVAQLSASQRQLSQLLRQGQEYVDAGEYHRAIAIYQQAANIDGNNAKIYSGLGYLQAKQGNYIEAAKAYQQAIRLDPNDPALYEALGYSWANNQKYENAASAYRKAIALQPDRVDSYIGLGVVLLRSQQYQQVIEIYHNLQLIQPNLPAAYELMATALIALERTDEILPLLDRASKRFAIDNTLRLKIVNQLISTGDIDTALNLLQQADLIEPRNFQVAMLKGDILLQQDELDSALAAYKQVVSLNPDSIEAQAKIGEIYLAQQNYISAVVAYRRIIQIDPNHPAGYYNLAIALYGRGKSSEAIEALKQARQLYVLKNDRAGMEQVDSLIKDIIKNDD